MDNVNVSLIVGKNSLRQFKTDNVKLSYSLGADPTVNLMVYNYDNTPITTTRVNKVRLELDICEAEKLRDKLTEYIECCKEQKI